jgi:hypothetical protein
MLNDKWEECPQADAALRAKRRDCLGPGIQESRSYRRYLSELAKARYVHRTRVIGAHADMEAPVTPADVEVAHVLLLGEVHAFLSCTFRIWEACYHSSVENHPLLIPVGQEVRGFLNPKRFERRLNTMPGNAAIPVLEPFAKRAGAAAAFRSAAEFRHVIVHPREALRVVWEPGQDAMVYPPRFDGDQELLPEDRSFSSLALVTDEITTDWLRVLLEFADACIEL